MATGRFFPATGVDLGTASSPTGSTLGADYRTFNQATLPRPGMLGHVVEDSGNMYQLVQVDTSDVASIDGGVAYWKTRSTSVVTPDASDSEGLADTIAGGTHVVVVSDALTHYIFIQVGGDQAAVVVAASAVAGDHLTGHATTDNVLTRTAAGTAAPDKQAATALSTRGTTTSDNGASVANSSKVRWIFGNLL